VNALVTTVVGSFPQRDWLIDRDGSTSGCRRGSGRASSGACRSRSSRKAVERVLEHRRYQLPHDQTSLVSGRPRQSRKEQRERFKPPLVLVEPPAVREVYAPNRIGGGDLAVVPVQQRKTAVRECGEFDGASHSAIEPSASISRRRRRPVCANHESELEYLANDCQGPTRERLEVVVPERLHLCSGFDRKGRVPSRSGTSVAVL
jgi:hypothetical protein